MKTNKYFFVLLLLVLILINWSSCEDICNGMGTLKLTNASLSTVQKILVDGVNYGTIDPGESKEIELAPGEHRFQQIGISGGAGCSEATVIIMACKTSAFECKN